MAVGVSSYLHKVACVHVEAGIRTITPRAEVFARFYDDFQAGPFDWDAYAAAMRDPATYERGSREPFPEQFNTRVSDAGTGYHAAPVELDPRVPARRGIPADTIEVVGQHRRGRHGGGAGRRRPARRSSRPTRSCKSGEFIRICIHRRENTDRRAPLPSAVRRDGEAGARRPVACC